MNSTRTRTRPPQSDLEKSLSAVTRTLKKNREALNEVDSYNHNHGDNMVKNFQVITKAVRAKNDRPPSEQLAYASQELSRRSQSGSAQVYAQGLARAASQMEGQSTLTRENALQLVQALMGGQAAGASQAGSMQPDALAGLLGGMMGGGSQSAPAGYGQADALSGLLGGMLGGMDQPRPSQTSSAQADPLAGLLGGLLGGGSQAGPSQAGAEGGVNLQMLMSAGLAFMQARQQGAEPLEALVQAVMSGSQMNANPSHSQSGQLVAGTLLNTIGSLFGGRK